MTGDMHPCRCCLKSLPIRGFSSVPGTTFTAPGQACLLTWGLLLAETRSAINAEYGSGNDGKRVQRLLVLGALDSLLVSGEHC